MDGQTIDVDKIQLELLSKCKFQILAFICLGIIYTRGAWNVFGVLFLASEVGHSCDSSREYMTLLSDSDTDGVFITHNSNINSTFGSTQMDNYSKESTFLFRECDVILSYVNGTNMTRPCTFGWVYRSQVESTIVSEWDLVCVRAYLSDLSTTFYMVGSMIGALLITPLADKFGRRLVLLICLLVQAVLGTCVSLSVNYTMFTTLRFIVGFLNMGIALSAYVMMTETFPAQHRTMPCCGFQIFWAVGIMLTALFGFLVKNWRHLQLVFSLPNLLCAILVWFLPESLPWLISKNKISRAKNVAERIAKFNGLHMPTVFCTPETLPMNGVNGQNNNITSDVTHCYDEHILPGPLSHQGAVLRAESSSSQEHLEITACNKAGYKKVAQNGSHCINSHASASHPLQLVTTPIDIEVQITGSKRATSTVSAVPADKEHSSDLSSAFILCRSSRICLYSVIIFYLFFVNSLSYFGISLSTPVLHGNQFLNLFFLGAVEIPAYIICVVVCNRFGRKAPLCLFLLLCGVMNLTAMLISEDTSKGMGVMRIVFVMIGKFAITGGYTTVYLYSAEIFPTSVRNHAIGISSFFENLGSIAAPFIVFSAKSVPELPMILFGVVSIIGSAMVITMPETHNRPLPQTIEEVESWDMCRRPRST